MAEGNVISVDLAAMQTSIRRRQVLTRPVRKSITIPAGGSLVTKSVSVTDVITETITGIECFLLIEADADLNVQVRQAAGVLQTMVVKGMFLLMGTLEEVKIAATSTIAVEARIYHS